MDPVPFAIVGAGWRSAFYLRVAHELPDRFRVSGVLTRRSDARERLGRDWGVAAHASLDDLLADRPAFTVVAASRIAVPPLLRELARLGMPVLSETPPAPDLAGLAGLRDLVERGARIQVAEQYQFQPLHAARLAVARSGRLGAITQAQVSIAHGYHGIDLLRRFLELGSEEVTITARRFTSPIVAGPDRTGQPRGHRIVPSEQLLAWLETSGKLGVLDFTDDQYFSWIRSPRLVVRGERGEIHDATVRYLVDALTPVTVELTRREAGREGNLEGFHLVAITAGAETLYRNPFVPARLSDDELAVATCLARMVEHLDGGPGFCSLAEAAEDQYLALLVDEAAATGVPVRSSPAGWATSDGRRF